jgi:hypothetical protein
LPALLFLERFDMTEQQILPSFPGSCCKSKQGSNGRNKLFSNHFDAAAADFFLFSLLLLQHSAGWRNSAIDQTVERVSQGYQLSLIHRVQYSFKILIIHCLSF